MKMGILAQSNVWQLIRSADVMTIIVLLLLLAMSVFCWTMFLYKWALWRVKKRQLKGAISHMKNAEKLEDVLYITSKFANTLPGYFLSKALKYLKSLLMTCSGSKKSLCERELGFLEHMIGQAHESVLYTEERLIPLVGACGTVAPLLGLFGTVWGLMNSFIGISHKQSADIAAVAPGIAQALVTTVAGLLVAIPAYIIYHYLSAQLRHIDQQITVLSDRFLWLAQRIFFGDNGDNK
jgi:biopolymer transport protein ExbB/TolQ